MTNEMIKGFWAAVDSRQNRNDNDGINWDFVLADLYMDHYKEIMEDEKSFLRNVHKLIDSVETQLAVAATA